MKTMHTKIKHIAIICIMVFSAGVIKAQQGNTFYYMNKVSQSTYFNPAYQSPYKVTVGGFMLPVVGQLPPTMYYNVASSGFQFSNFIHEGTGDKADSLVMDPQGLIDQMRTANHVRMNTHIDLLHVGITTENNAYLTFSITEKINTGFSLPRDLFELAWYGNNYFRENNEKVLLSDLNVNFTHYREFAGGFSTEVIEGLTVGGRAKVLFGLSNVHTKINELSLFTNQDDYGITAVADAEVYINTPVPVEYDRDSVEFTVDSLWNENMKIGSYLSNMKNPGFGLDIGATYKINNDFTAYFSVNDIGFISWGSNPLHLSTDGTFTFRGIEVDFFADEEEFDENMEEFADSVLHIFAPVDDNNTYLTWLPTDIYVGGQYHFHDMLDFGALYRMELYQRNALHSLTLSANSNLTDWFSAHLSYSMMNNSYNNIGFGFMIRGAMLQYYLVSDNIMAAFQPHKTRNLNIRMGCNLVFGYKKLKSESLL